MARVTGEQARGSRSSPEKLGGCLDHAGGDGGGQNIQILGPWKVEPTALARGGDVSCSKKRD